MDKSIFLSQLEWTCLCGTDFPDNRHCSRSVSRPIFAVLTFQTTGIVGGQLGDLFLLVADSQGSMLPAVKACNNE